MKQEKLSSKVARAGLLTALALTLGYLESLLPPMPFLPPGVKPGLGNIVILYALLRLDGKTVLPLVVLKSLFALLTRGVTAGFLSLCGGMLSFVLLLLFLRLGRERMSLTMLSVSGALAHNLGQLLGCALMMNDAAVFWYAPPLCIFGALAGFVTAAALRLCEPYLDRAARL